MGQRALTYIDGSTVCKTLPSDGLRCNLSTDLKKNRGKYVDNGWKVAKERKKGEDKDRDKFDW
jgi:hypothetical protein